jgi:hypothetical protein
VIRYTSALLPATPGGKKVVLHVSLAFASLPDPGLDSFVETISAQLYGNAAYTTPPVTKVALDAANSDFTTKLAAAATGGQTETAAKNASRQVLIGILRQLANYVQGACNNDLPTLLSSGFQAASTERRQEPLAKPEGLVLKNGDTGQLIAKVKPVKNTKMYEGRVSADGGTTWLPSVFTGDSQHVLFAGLTPGQEYTIQIRALGGSTGQSDWSDPVKHRSM